MFKVVGVGLRVLAVFLSYNSQTFAFATDTGKKVSIVLGFETFLKTDSETGQLFLDKWGDCPEYFAEGTFDCRVILSGIDTGEGLSDLKIKAFPRKSPTFLGAPSWSGKDDEELASFSHQDLVRTFGFVRGVDGRIWVNTVNIANGMKLISSIYDFCSIYKRRENIPQASSLTYCLHLEMKTNSLRENVDIFEFDTSHFMAESNEYFSRLAEVGGIVKEIFPRGRVDEVYRDGLSFDYSRVYKSFPTLPKVGSTVKHVIRLSQNRLN